MSRHYDENVVIQFNDVRTLIREEFDLMFEKLAVREHEIQVSPKSKVQLENPTTSKPLSIQQLADRYEVSKATVHNWRNQGLITGFKLGKGRFFHVAEVEKNLTQYRYLDVLAKQGLIKEKPKQIITFD